MCGKASVSHLSWAEVYAFATSFTAPATLPADPESRVNVSPSRLRRKSEPDSMVWEFLPVVYPEGSVDAPAEAVWPFLPPWSRGSLPRVKDGRILSTANARLRRDGQPFAPTFMGAWERGLRVVVLVSWFYEFDSRVRPQVPFAVFPLNAPFWMMAGLANWTRMPNGERRLSVAIVTVEPNEVLSSVGHHRSPALLRNSEEALAWMREDPADSLDLLRSYPNETMGVEAVPMGIKIPGNQSIELPAVLQKR